MPRRELIMRDILTLEHIEIILDGMKEGIPVRKIMEETGRTEKRIEFLWMFYNKWKETGSVWSGHQRVVDLFKEYNKKYRDKNKDKKYKLTEKQKLKKKAYTKKWLEENKEIVKIQKNKYKTEKIKNDVLFSLKHNINTSILYHLRSCGYSKKSRTHEIIGCSFEDFKIYLESKFENWMTWENRGMYNGEFNYGWDIDHIIPISSALTEEDIIRLNHYTNLQPLCSKINRDLKRDKI
jgi:hypothetical protein